MEVGNIAYDIITLIKEGKDESQVVKEIQNKNGHAAPSSIQIHDFIANNGLGSGAQRTNKSLESIKLRKAFFHPSKNLRILSSISPVFNWWPAIFFLFIFVSSAVYFFQEFGISRHSFRLDWQESIVFYLAIFAIMFIHETGHAIASIKHGKCPGEIGVGIYFIFPVMYTDVSSAWLLNAKKRIEINFGGLYFQSILSTVIVLAALFTHSHFFQLLFFSNLIMMLYSFNPFFKYDGYWIFSDLFGLKNLRTKAQGLTKTFFIKPMEVLKGKVYSSPALIVYTILSNLFFLFQIYLLSALTLFNIRHLNGILSEEKFSYNLSTAQTIISVSLNTIFIAIIFQRIFSILKETKNVK